MKLISFRTLRENCYYCITDWDEKLTRITYYFCQKIRKRCCEKNCPVWKRLEKVKGCKR